MSDFLRPACVSLISVRLDVPAVRKDPIVLVATDIFDVDINVCRFGSNKATNETVCVHSSYTRLQPCNTSADGFPQTQISKPLSDPGNNSHRCIFPVCANTLDVIVFTFKSCDCTAAIPSTKFHLRTPVIKALQMRNQWYTSATEALELSLLVIATGAFEYHSFSLRLNNDPFHPAQFDDGGKCIIDGKYMFHARRKIACRFASNESP